MCTTYTRAHVASHVHTALKVFARGGQYSPTTRTTPSRPRWKRELGGGGDTILPSCRSRDIFSLSRDNLETGVALPARECSAEERDTRPPARTPFSRYSLHSRPSSVRPPPFFAESRKDPPGSYVTFPRGK